MDKSAVLSARFFERLERNFVEFADLVAFSYNGDERQITYKELNEISARVHGYLKAKGLKPDDFVMIKLPRGAEAGAVAIGVLRAGVAYTIVEEGYPQERIDFIYKDCGCKLCIDSVCYKEILNIEPVYGFEEVDDHKAAYAVYTSGTTGTAKGVLIERGVLDSSIHEIFNKRDIIFSNNDKFACISPLSFVALEIFMLPILYAGGEFDVVATEVVKSPDAFCRFIAEHSINTAFLPPSLLRLFSEFPTSITRLYTGSEPVRNVFIENVSIMSIYAQSETGSITSVFKIDKPYELTPAGKSCVKIKLLDESGKEAETGELGEICLDNPYFRGYINRPEENERAFRGGIYHTGDLGRLLEDGSIVLSGRADDMVKINGNRVEPAEIEEVVKNAFGINWAAAKVIDRNGHKSVCVYYVDKPKTDIEEAKKQIASKLPAYMVPANYMQIVKIPLNANGKFSRRNLPDPQEQTENYKKPQTDLEQKLFDIVAENINTVSFGTDTSLIALGLDSIAVMKLCKDIAEKLGKEISFADVMKNPTVLAIAETLEKDRKNAVTAYPVQKYYPLTENQRGLYINWEIDRETTQYNIPVYYCFRNYDSKKLVKAVEKAVNAHSYLKTRLEFVDGEPVQKRCDTDKVVINQYSLKSAPDKNFFQKLVKPFKLLSDALYRINVYTYGSSVYLFMDFHHIVFDGMSSHVLLNDIIKAYNNNELTAEKITAYDFALYQKEFEKSEKYKSAEKYFDDILGDAEPARLTAYSKADGKSFSKITKRFSSVDIFDYCRRNGVTASSFMHAVFAETIHRITRENEFLYATVSNGRSADNALQKCTGMFVQTLPVVWKSDVESLKPEVNSRQLSATSSQPREDIRQSEADRQKPAVDHGDLLVTDYINSIHEQLQKTFENECYPYTKFSERHKTSAEIMFIYQGGILGDNVLTDDKSIKVSPLDTDKSVFSANILVYPVGDDFELRLEYDGMIYGCRDMQTLAEAVTNTALNMTSAERIKDVTLTGKEQKAAIISASAGEKLEYDKSRTWVAMFKHQVTEHPDSLAVVDYAGSITYRELGRQSDAVAAYLLNNGVKTNDFVAIKMGRVKEFMIAVIGINKAGAAYVPIDPEYPEDRIAYMLEDCNAKQILTETVVAEAIAQFSGAEPVNNAKPDVHAYMIYTSGSTGKPKGVVISHKSVTACAAWYIRDLKLDVTRKELHHPSFSFDASTMDIIYPLAAGGVVHILSEEQRKDIGFITEYIKNNGITGMNLSTAMGMAILNNAELELDFVMMGGEKMLPVRKTDTRIINGYGPTEFTVCSCYHIVNQDTDTDIPIGRPVPNSYSVICDSYGNLMPAGVAGELCLAGDQISEGYWNRPELNAEKFAPIAALGNQPVYRTGDLARYNEAGNLEYFGRIDFQVKLRGFRIELGEIDNVALQFNGIKQVIAQVKKLGIADSLVLYYSADRQIDKDELKAFMAKSLTDYMVPTEFMQLDEMPMTPNGKIDRKKLPDPQFVDVTPYVAPSSEIEKVLCFTLADVMGLEYEKAGIKSDFFALGGTSLLAMKFVAKAKIKSLTVIDVYNGKTVEGIAAIVNKKSESSNIGEKMEAVEAEARKKSYPLSVQQIQMLDSQFYKISGEMWNMPNLLQFPSDIDENRLSDAVNRAIKNHPSLLSIIYTEKDGIPEIRYAPELYKDVCVEYISEKDLEELKAYLVKPYRLIKSLLCRARVFKTEKYCYLFFDVHHIIADGRSIDILLADILRAYNDEELKTDYYYSHLASIEEIKNTEAYEKFGKFFSYYVNTAWTVAPAADRTSDVIKDGILNAALEVKVSDIESAEKRLKVSRNVIATAAGMLALADITNQKNIYIEWLYDNRVDIELGNSFGNLIKSMPVAMKLSGNEKQRDILQEVNRQISEGIANSAYDFDMPINSNIKTQAMEVNYLQGMGQVTSDIGNKSLKVANIPLKDSQRLAGSRMELYIFESDNSILLNITYLASMYNESTMKKYADLFNKYMVSLSLLESD